MLEELPLLHFLEAELNFKTSGTFTELAESQILKIGSFINGDIYKFIVYHVFIHKFYEKKTIKIKNESYYILNNKHMSVILRLP